MLSSFLIKGQVSGYVYDSNTKEPLAFCNIICKATNAGTTTSINGKFDIDTKLKSKLYISFIGYQSKEILITNKDLGKIYLDPESALIAEVKIVMKEDPAVILMKETIKRKNDLRPQKDIRGMQTEDLLRVYLSDPNYSIPVLNNSDLFIQKSDSMLNGVPFFISKKRLHNDSLLSENNYGVGIQHDFFVDYINSLNFNYDIYDDLINVMGRSITSPLSTNAFSFYKYYLIDSCFINSNYCYKVKITAKRKNDPVFLGNIWIEKKSFKVKKINISLENQYINLVDGLTLSQEFNDKNGLIFESHNSIEFNILSDDLPIIPDSIFLRIKKQVHRTEFDLTSNTSTLETKEIESEIQIMNSLNNDPNIKLATKLSEILITSHYTIGKIDIGPIYSIYSSNKVEGKRPSFLFRTNKYFMQNLLISGYTGYGMSDQRYKYGFQFKIRDKEEKSLEFSINYENYIESMGDKYIYRALHPNLFQASGNDVFTSLFTGMQEGKMLYFTESKGKVKKEFGNLDLSVYFSRKKIEKNTDLAINNNIIQATLGFGLRFSKSKKVKNHFNTVNVKSTAPLFSADISISDKKYLGADYNIIKAKLIIRQNFNSTFFGRTRYLIDVGYYKIIDPIPLMFLENHRGNDTYVYDLTKSSLMNQNEFVSDRYIAFYIDQHLNGRIFNHIPLLNKLEIRETIIGNIIFGHLHQKSLQNNLPDFTSALNYNLPYAEVGVGIENIFKLLRLNFIWRLSYLDAPRVSSFGITGGFYFNF